MTVHQAGFCQMRPTPYATRMVAGFWYAKGKSFLRAAVLLHKHGGEEYVVLHLLAQGIEIVLKSLLLFVDYDNNKSKLKGRYGHQLMPLTADVLSAFRLNPLRPELSGELRGLSSLYQQHLLRYGSLHDILVDPSTIPTRLVMRRIVAAIRLAERGMTRPQV